MATNSSQYPREYFVAGNSITPKKNSCNILVLKTCVKLVN